MVSHVPHGDNPRGKISHSSPQKLPMRIGLLGGGVIARLGTMTQGQGHATTYAQIIATELGLPASDIVVEEGDTDKAPYGAGT